MIMAGGIYRLNTIRRMTDNTPAPCQLNVGSILLIRCFVLFAATAEMHQATTDNEIYMAALRCGSRPVYILMRSKQLYRSSGVKGRNVR